MRIRGSSQQGFTIMEAVVASAVFAFVVTSSMGVYLATIKLDSKSRTARSVQQNARFIMDYISKEVRNGSIDYTGENDSDTLTLINQQNQQEIFQLTGTNLTLRKPIVAGGVATNLNSADVEISRLAFYLSPSTNPFVLANDAHIQPHVTVIMTVRSKNQTSGEKETLDLESTFTVRDYPSRQ